MYKHTAFTYSEKNSSVTKLLVFGGVNNTKKFETVHEFDFSTSKWQLIQTKNTPLLKARFAYSSCISYNSNQVFIFGGLVDGKLFNDVIKYDIEEKKFYKVKIRNEEEAPLPREFH